ncbi:acyltransferase [Streptococcus equinus]|uniref:acyltransferase n=1 Tax=Streptococcus equinus TaxID=1335 RepID=UPI0008EAD99F|nr:acyltransferase [Streptococcus equinus]SFG22626.1 hypothetical protein SAMN05216385_1757 [Streptococcus equinus]
MGKIKLIFEHIISIPKTLWVNFTSLPFKQAVKLPIYVHYNVIFKNKGKIELLSADVSRYSVIFGKQGSFHISPKKSIVVINKGGKLILGSNILFSSGINLIVESNAKMTIGDNTSFNRNVSIFSKYLVEIGLDCLFGWGVSIRDNDGHFIDYPGKKTKNNNFVRIGDHCWIAAECLLMKGTFLAQNSVVGTWSLVNKAFYDENILVVGSPAKMIKSNITWKE